MRKIANLVPLRVDFTLGSSLLDKLKGNINIDIVSDVVIDLRVPFETLRDARSSPFPLR